MRSRIARYRRTDSRDLTDFPIGCRILTQPFFLDEYNWLPVPTSFSPNIVTFKTYSLDDPDGRHLWEAVQKGMGYSSPQGLADSDVPRYGEPIAVKPRLGQGAFRVLVTDIYNRRCAVTNERTLPALDAAHIRPYSQGGLHVPSNGLLLRRDIHSLLDSGYVTVTPDFRFEVSRRIREEFENGRDYYALHGKPVSVPSECESRPDPRVLTWHNDECFLG